MFEECLFNISQTHSTVCYLELLFVSLCCFTLLSGADADWGKPCRKYEGNRSV